MPTAPKLPPRPSFARADVPDVTTAHRPPKPVLPTVPAKDRDGGTNSRSGKAAQRARNSADGNKPARAGSSGKGLAIVSFPQVDWDEVEDEVDHIVDIAGVFSHTQMGVSGNVSANLNVPLSYSMAMWAAHNASRDGMVYIRVYGISFDKFKEKMEQEAQERAAEMERRAIGDGRQLNLDEQLESFIFE